jgi:hypothetical protein
MPFFRALCSRLANNNLTGVADVQSSNCCETKKIVGPTVGKNLPVYLDSAGTHYFSNKTEFAEGLIGCDSGVAGPMPLTVESFKLSFSVGCKEAQNLNVKPEPCEGARIPVLNVRSNAPWEVNLTVQCCGTCSPAAVSQLEEVDLSNNRMRGPPPLSLANLKASFRKLNLTYNHFEGDYTLLAEIARSFARADGEAIALTIRPQMPCADGFYADAIGAAQDILPTCTPKPVRLPKALRRRQAAAAALSVCTGPEVRRVQPASAAHT